MGVRAPESEEDERMGNIVSGGGMFGRIMGGFFKEETPKALADGFSGAFERGDTKMLAQLLRQVKRMSENGEQQFLRSVLKAHRRKAGGRGAAAFRDLVMSALSPEQRQALGHELFGGARPKVIGRGELPSPEVMLEKFLLGIGSPEVGKLPLLRDGIERLPLCMSAVLVIPRLARSAPEGKS